MSTTRESSLSVLTPSVREAVGEGLRICGGKGVPILVYETRRSLARQAELYAQGRTAPGPIVTNAKPGASKHNPGPDGLGGAIDCVPYEFAIVSGQPVGKLDWSPFPSTLEEQRFKADGNLAHLDSRWRAMVEAFESCGLEWAGRWTSFVEYVHFQGRK